MKVVYQVYRKLTQAEKRNPMAHGCDMGVYAGYFVSKKDAEKLAKKVGGWVEKVIIEEV